MNEEKWKQVVEALKPITEELLKVSKDMDTGMLSVTFDGIDGYVSVSHIDSTNPNIYSAVKFGDVELEPNSRIRKVPDASLDE